MFIFDETAHVLRKGNETGERLNKIAKESGKLIISMFKYKTAIVARPPYNIYAVPSIALKN